MKVTQLFLAVAVVVCLGLLHAKADTIPVNIDVSQSTTISGTGSKLTVSGNGGVITAMTLNNSLVGTDSASYSPLTFGGVFTFAANGGGAGTFSPNGNSAPFTMGSLATSGTVTGSINSVSIAYAGLNGTTYSYDVNFNFTNLTFHNCTGAGCTNSSALQQFAAGNSGNAIFNFTLAGPQYSSLAQLLDFNGQLTTGGSVSLNDNAPSMTPEPASLAMFGSGLAIFGARIRRRQKKA